MLSAEIFEYSPLEHSWLRAGDGVEAYDCCGTKDCDCIGQGYGVVENECWLHLISADKTELLRASLIWDCSNFGNCFVILDMLKKKQVSIVKIF